MMIGDFEIPNNWPGSYDVFGAPYAFEPESITYKHGGFPLLTHRALNGRLLLCLAFCAENDHLWFVITPTNNLILTALNDNKITLKDALNQAWIWLVPLIGNKWGIGFDVPELKVLPLPTSI